MSVFPFTNEKCEQFCSLFEDAFELLTYSSVFYVNVYNNVCFFTMYLNPLISRLKMGFLKSLLPKRKDRKEDQIKVL